MSQPSEPPRRSSDLIFKTVISQDAGSYNQKPNIYLPKITLLRTIHPDSSQCEVYEKLNFWPE